MSAPFDVISILNHPTNILAKIWQADGKIKDYDRAKYFNRSEQERKNILELSTFLAELEQDPHRCIIRGKYIGDEAAKTVDPEYKKGKVRRLLAVIKDQLLHTTLIEVDGFKPKTGDPVTEPEKCIEEYIFEKLPACFHNVSYHWQMSNSAGHESKKYLLKVHLWFWLKTPYTSAQLKMWHQTQNIECDKSVFNPAQVHYTAAPVFEAGVIDPVPVRSGFVRGMADDEVDLVIDEAVITSTKEVAETRQERMINAGHNDPVARHLYEKGLVKGVGSEGKLNIICPFQEAHTSGSTETSTVYFPAHTGGYSNGAFDCKHAHCLDRKRSEFLEKINWVEDDSGILPSGEKTIPEANSLVTHQANFSRLINHFGSRLLVSASCWFVWRGTHWTDSEGEVYKYVCELSGIILKEAEEWERKPIKSEEEKEYNTNIAKALRKWAMHSEMRNNIDAVVALGRKMLAIPEDQLNRDPWALNCLNGTIDLRTGILRPHDPTDYITCVIPVEYDPSVESEMFKNVLAQITLEEGKPAKPLADFLQRWFGYCATGSIREHKFVVHYGLGRNGKSTVLDTLGDILNDYATTAAPGLLVTSGRDRHPTEIADLFNRRMVTAHETGDGNKLREDFIKQATGGDKIKARYIRQDFFEFSPTHKLQLLTNYKPVIRGQDPAIWQRVLLFPYKARFGTKEEVSSGKAMFLKDTDLKEKLNSEKKGILNWIVQGAVSWFQNGLNPPDAVLAASKDYQAEQDKVHQFISEKCELGNDFEGCFSDGCFGLFPTYTDWCRASGFQPFAKNRFSTELERLVPHFERIEKKIPDSAGKRRDRVLIKGIRLVETD